MHLYCLPVFTFFARICCTALDDGHGEENNVQREKHRAQLTSRMHRHFAVPMRVIFEKERMAKNTDRERWCKIQTDEPRSETRKACAEQLQTHCSPPLLWSQPLFCQKVLSLLRKQAFSGGRRGEEDEEEERGRRRCSLQVLMPHLLPSTQPVSKPVCVQINSHFHLIVSRKGAGDRKEKKRCCI